jgi:hypothetical protein
MEPTEKTTASESVPNNDTNDTPVAPYTLLYINRAYNRKEITFAQWLQLTKEWAEHMIKRYGKAQ